MTVCPLQGGEGSGEDGEELLDFPRPDETDVSTPQTHEAFVSWVYAKLKVEFEIQNLDHR